MNHIRFLPATPVTLAMALLGLAFGGCAGGVFQTPSDSGGQPGSGGSSTAGMGGGSGMGGGPGTGGSATGAAGAGAGTGGRAGMGGGSGTGGRATGGTVGTNGTGGSGMGGSVVGGTGGSGVVINEGPCDLTAIRFTGAATRPQLTDVSAPCFTPRRYLAGGDSWDPTAGLPAASTLVPKYTVAADGSGTQTTVQAAITAAMQAGGTARVAILVKPGTYHELVCVTGTVPITLYGADADATRVTIAFNNVAQQIAVTGRINPCTAVQAGNAYSTSGSPSFFVKSNNFQAMNLTIANDADEAAVGATVNPPQAAGGTLQAVAMLTTGDKLVFQNVRFIGNQDTLLADSTAATAVARSYYKSSYIEGDTDFIFGKGVVVFDGCSITYVGLRKTGGSHTAPSTDGALPYGFLIVNSHIVSGPGAQAGRTTLGRAYDPSNQPTANGQLVIRDTVIDAHVNLTTPWGASTQGRAFDAATNRLYEYKNTGAGAAR